MKFYGIDLLEFIVTIEEFGDSATNKVRLIVILSSFFSTISDYYHVLSINTWA